MDLSDRGGCEGDRLEREEVGAPGGSECGAEDLLFRRTHTHTNIPNQIMHNGSSQDEGSDDLDTLKVGEDEKDVLPSANSACNEHYPVPS